MYIFLATECRREGIKMFFNLMIVHFYILVENWIYYDAIHDFSEKPRTGSNPSDINRFQKQYEKFYY